MAYQMPQDPTAVMGRRVVAYIIDTLIGMFIVGAVFMSTAESASGFPDDYCDVVNEMEDVSSCLQVGDTVYVLAGEDNAPIGLVALAYGFGVFGLLQGLTGASIGKYMTGLRVVKADGTVCGVGRATARWAMFIVDAFFCFLVGLITAAATKPHRRVGDFVAGTFVVGKAWVGTPLVGAPPGYGPPPGYGTPPGYGPPPGQPPGPPAVGWEPPSTPPQPGGWSPQPTAPPVGPPTQTPPQPGPPTGTWGSPPPPDDQ